MKVNNAIANFILHVYDIFFQSTKISLVPEDLPDQIQAAFEEGTVQTYSTNSPYFLKHKYFDIYSPLGVWYAFSDKIILKGCEIDLSSRLLYANNGIISMISHMSRNAA